MNPARALTPPESEIKALLEKTAEACRAKDAAALSACFSSQVIAFDLIAPLQYQGAESIARRAAEWFSSWQGDFVYEVHQLTVAASGETAFAHSLNYVSGRTTDGSTVQMWWRATVCCQRIGGQWLITHQHSSVPFDMETRQAKLDLQP